ncbi:hypothetical protein CBFG_04639 [Clostridiales bacterium 1_7_47FAA]|nr:hypothetical protein CBFG_04639 [Clostridiales bacterium 1_7_47FAA]
MYHLPVSFPIAVQLIIIFFIHANHMPTLYHTAPSFFVYFLYMFSDDHALFIQSNAPNPLISASCYLAQFLLFKSWCKGARPWRPINGKNLTSIKYEGGI